MAKKIKSITNIHTVGELKKFLRGMPDDIILQTSDGESCYSEDLSFMYIPHLREFKISIPYDDYYMKRNNNDVIVE